MPSSIGIIFRPCLADFIVQDPVAGGDGLEPLLAHTDVPNPDSSTSPGATQSPDRSGRPLDLVHVQLTSVSSPFRI